MQLKKTFIKIRFAFLLALLLCGFFLPLALASITYTGNVNLVYNNGSYTVLPAGTYDNVSRLNNVWYVNGAMFPAADTYAMSLSIASPTNTTYTNSTVNYSVSNTGNETNPLYQIALYKGGVAVLLANRTSATGTFYSLANGTYTFVCYAIGDHSASDYDTVVFTVSCYVSPVASTELINYSGFTLSQRNAFISYCLTQNITEFTLRIPAYSDWSDGVLSSTWETATLALISVANTAGIKVNIDIHTWYTTWDSYFDDSASNYVANRATYLLYVTDTVTKLDGSGVKAFMALNEPQWQTATPSENNFIISCVTTAKAATQKPVSVRFMAGASPWEDSHHYGSSISPYLDFYCINSYWNPLNPGVQINNSGEQDIIDTRDAAHAVGKEVWNTEFGNSSSIDETQRIYVAAWVAYARTHSIDRIFCWASSPTTTESYNIFTTSFVPRPAFYELGGTLPASQYYITVNSTQGSPTASGFIDAGGSYATSVTSPYAGTEGIRYVCTGYSIDNGGAGVQYSGVSYTFTNVQANHTITYYWQTQYYLTITSSYGSPTGQGWYNASSTAAFSVASTVSGGAGTQYLFNGWVGTGTGSYTGSSNSTSVTMNAPITETANWITQFYLTVSSIHGVTSGTGWYNGGTIAYAGLDAGTQVDGGVTYTFSGWSTGGSNYAQSSAIIMTGPITSVAYWIPGIQQYIITSSAGSGGSISPDGATAIYSGGSQTYTIAANSGYAVAQVLVNGEDKGAILTYTFTNVTADQTIRALFIPSYTAAGTQTLTFYMRSDTYTFNNVSGYGLDLDYTNNYVNIPISTTITSNVTYGFRVYVVTSPTVSSELTSGVPEGLIFLNNNFTGQISSSWVCPGSSLLLGYQALEVDVYVSVDGGVTWTNQAIFITNVLISKQLVSSLWTISLNANMTAIGTMDCSFSFGDTNHRSIISGVTILTPKESDIQLWRFNRGDYIGFEIGAYYDVIGSAFYVLLLLLFAGVLYFRYGHFGTVAFFFVIFGGSGGLVWILLPVWAASVASAVIIVGLSFVVWRVIR